MGELLLKNLTIRYGSAAVIREFDLAVHDGEMVASAGPQRRRENHGSQGSGRPDPPAARGNHSSTGNPVQHLPPEKRSAVMVFQKSLLFPFINVAQNIAIRLAHAGTPRPGIARQNDPGSWN